MQNVFLKYNLYSVQSTSQYSTVHTMVRFNMYYTFPLKYKCMISLRNTTHISTVEVSQVATSGLSGRVLTDFSWGRKCKQSASETEVWSNK